MSTITQGFLDHPIFQIVSQTAQEQGVRAFVIGGYVRDCFLGRPSKDIDIVVEGSGIALAEAVGERVRSNVSVFKNFGTAMLRYHGIEVETLVLHGGDLYKVTKKLHGEVADFVSRFHPCIQGCVFGRHLGHVLLQPQVFRALHKGTVFRF